MPAIAGPTMRAPLNIDEFSAMAFIRSSRPTISTMNACRAGISNALTTPSNAARTKISDWTAMAECPRTSTRATIAKVWVAITSFFG